jgi:hypothetical protein
VIAHERKLHRAEIARLELRFDAEMHELTKRQTIEPAEHRERDGVVGLPRFIGRRHEDAA